MHHPGIEPRATRWQRAILPLNQWCFTVAATIALMCNSILTVWIVYIHSLTSLPAQPTNAPTQPHQFLHPTTSTNTNNHPSILPQSLHLQLMPLLRFRLMLVVTEYRYKKVFSYLIVKNPIAC